MNVRQAAALILLISVAAVADEQYDHQLDDVSDDLRLVKKIEGMARPLTDCPLSRSGAGYVLRSEHFIFGMPRPLDGRRNGSTRESGISLLVREGFVVAHFDRMRSPLWVCQRWTDDELNEDKPKVPSLGRDWKNDPELPADARVGTGYSGNATGLDRGHMAKHSMNRAWERDSSIQGCLMSNSTPQHKNINRRPGDWWKLEDEVENIVGTPEAGISALWTISDAALRDEENPVDESLQVDFSSVVTITKGFGVPDATFKIVAWFTEGGAFRALGYVFEQPHRKDGDSLVFDIPDQARELASFIVPIDEIERRTGVDFFSCLRDSIENAIEARSYATTWSAE